MDDNGAQEGQSLQRVSFSLFDWILTQIFDTH